jgi:hypothetical protein
MVRLISLIALCTLMLQVPASAQQPTPTDTGGLCACHRNPSAGPVEKSGGDS